MQPVKSDRVARQEDFNDQVKASSAFALVLKRFGVEMKAVANGEGITRTGRMLTMVKKRFSGAFAFLAGSDNFVVQLALAQQFANTLNTQKAAAEVQHQFDRYSSITRSPDAKTVNAEFRHVSTPRTVFKQLEKDQLSFEQIIDEITDEIAPDFIGPSADLFAAFENSSKTHGLKVTAFDAGKPVEYAHCVNKVDSLTANFEENSSFFKNLFEPRELVEVYGHAATPQTVVSIQPDTPRATNQPCFVHP